MNLDKIAYVSVLKWRRAEMWALNNLEEHRSDRLLPLVEIVLPVPSDDSSKTVAVATPKPISDEEKMTRKENEAIELFLGGKNGKRGKKDEIVSKIRDTWGDRPIIVDLTLIYHAEAKLAGLLAISQSPDRHGLNLIPTVNLSDDVAYQQAVAEVLGEEFNTICIRVTTPDIKSIGELNSRLNELLDRLNIDRRSAVLLIDLKEDVGDQVYRETVFSSQHIDYLEDWGLVTIASGAFPSNLSDCRVDADNLLPRHDWLSWLRYGRRSNLKRPPIFADYAIRHPVYRFDWQFYLPSSSLKYTLEQDWWVIRGAKGNPEQYLAAAQALASHKGRFRGSGYSVGDSLIHEKSVYHQKEMRKRAATASSSSKSPKLKTGNAEYWIKVGLNQHLALTIDQISNLDDD